MYRRRGVEQRLKDPPRLLDGVLAGEPDALADERRVEQNLVRRRTLTAFRRELHVEVDAARAVGAMRLQLEPNACRRVELDDQLVRLDLAVERREPESRWMLEHEPQLRLRHGQPLAGADEERHSGPAPVLDLELQRGVGLRG